MWGKVGKVRKISWRDYEEPWIVRVFFNMKGVRKHCLFLSWSNWLGLITIAVIQMYRDWDEVLDLYNSCGNKNEDTKAKCLKNTI